MIATKLVALAAVLVGVNVAALEAPLPGYEVVDIEWEVEVPGGESITVNGTVQDAAAAIQQVEPTFSIDLDAPLPEIRSAHIEKRRVDCGGRWPYCPTKRIREGIKYLHGVSGKPKAGPGPGKCGRVSCSYKSAIWWCNDSKNSKTLNSFSSIANSAQKIVDKCSQRAGSTDLVSGQNFESTDWNTIVREDKNSC